MDRVEIRRVGGVVRRWVGGLAVAVVWLALGALALAAPGEGPRLIASPPGFSFISSPGQVSTGSGVQIHTGSSSARIPIFVSSEGQNNWFSISLSDAQTPSGLLYSFDATNLLPGFYFDRVFVTSTWEDIDLLIIPITLTVIDVPLETATPTSIPTFTPTPTATPTPTVTPTATSTPTSTPTPTATSTPRPTPPTEGDLRAPVLAELSLAPVDVVTLQEAQSIVVTAHVTDDWSGVHTLGLSFGPDGGGSQSVSVWLNWNNRISGDEWNGVYRGWLTVPQYSAGGGWHLRYVSLRDGVGNLVTSDDRSQGWDEWLRSTPIMSQFWNNYPYRLYLPGVGW